MTAIKEPPARTALAAPPAVAAERNRRHLRNDIVGGAFTIAFFLMVVVFVISFLWQREGLTAAALDRVAGVASVQEARIDDYLADGAHHAGFVASRPLVVSALAAELVVAPGPERLRTYLEVAPDVAWITVYDRALNPVASTQAPIMDVPHDYLERALGGSAIGLVVPGSGGVDYHLVGTQVVSGERPVGVVVIAQSTAELHEMATDYTGLGDTGETALAQATAGGGAQYIAPLRAEPDASMNKVVTQEEGHLPALRVLNGGSYLSTDSVDYRGIPVFSAGRHIEQAGWALVVKIDRAEAMAPLGDFVRTGLIALIVGSVLAGALAWQVAKHIRQPIVEMKDAAMAIAAGDRSRRVPNGRRDEIGDLVHSFNAMTGELDDLTNDLEHQVAERTSQLETKNRELRGLMDAKETFLAGVSHEVRGPLTAMIGFLDLARDDTFSDEVERGPMLDAAMQQAEEVLVLIEDLLAAARAESGSLQLAAVRVNLHAQVAQVMEGLSSGQRETVTVISGDGGIALGDPARARQVIRNLVTNAIRYGGPRIEVVASSGGGRATVLVRDDGDGVPEADRETIFTAFGQASGGRKVASSVGIGLHVSRQLAELMGGELTYDHVDGWSVFAFHLPQYAD